MKKAVPVALVLIAGAAVILWFGNRLNSWILGGLIGGLASLLLSVPISLALFSYFARQHAEHERYTRIIRKRLRSKRSSYLPEEIDTGYYDEYASVDGEVSTRVEQYDQPPTAGRKSGWLDEEFGFSDPPSRQLLPPSSSRRATGNVSTRNLTSDAGEEYRTRKTTVRRPAYPGLPSSQQNSFRSRFRSNALRTARLEAARQSVEEDDLSLDDYDKPSSSPSASSRGGREPRTDQLSSDPFSEDVHRPLQRRAPYTYEDDEIWEEMAHYRETPPLVRRSTRYLHERKNDDEAQ